MSKRENVLGWIRISGYHDDTKEFVRLYCENRIAYGAALVKFREGAQAKKMGMPCSCSECNRGKLQKVNP